MKLLYRIFAYSNHFYHNTCRAKASFNWFVGNLCASPPGISIYNIVKRRYLNFPKRVHIETTSYCNARCEMCPHAIMPRRSRHMDQALYDKIIFELSHHRNEVDTVSLHFLGEPLMDPLIFERIKQAKDAGIRKVQMNTNAQLLNEQYAENLIKSGIDAVTFSLGALEPETQEKRRVGTSLRTIENNIDSFIKMTKKTISNKKPSIIIYTIRSFAEDSAWKPIVNKYRNLVDEIAVINENPWGTKQKNAAKEPGLTRFRIPCPLIFSTLPINVDGKINLCCRDYADREIMGSLYESDIYDIWNGKMEQYRLLHMKNKSERIPLCEECTIYR